jgi:putative ABC transport system permease protein
MIAPRWRKVLADLTSSRTRTILASLSIAVGVFAVGMVSGAYVIIQHDLDADYASVTPHGAVLYAMPFDDELVRAAGREPGVEFAEGRSSVPARAQKADGTWYPIAFTSIPALDEMHIDRLRIDEVLNTSLAEDEIYIERSSRAVLGVNLGDRLTVELQDKRTRRLTVAGFVHDVTAFPAFATGQAAAYVSPLTLENLGGSEQYDQMLLTVAEGKNDEAHVKEVAHRVAERIEKTGRIVYVTLVYKPGEHPFRSTVQALLVLLLGLGVLSVLLSAFLVTNTITALLSQQIRQIGVMKSIGARRHQIFGMYLTLVLLLGFMALVIAMPLAALTSYGLSQFIAGFLNFNLSGFRIPLASALLQLVVALVVPLLAAVIPVRNGARITVREAVTSYGLSGGIFGQGWIDHVLERIRGLSRPLLISLRNTFRRKARLLLTLSTLTLGGAIFIAVFNVRTAINQTVSETLGYFLSDINVSFPTYNRISEVKKIAGEVPQIEGIEGWGIASGQVLSPDKSTGTDILIWGPPNDSHLIKPVLTSGRWLVAQDENAIVISNHLITQRPDLGVGSQIITRIGDQEDVWTVVGVAKMAGNFAMPFTYANYDYMTRLIHTVGRTTEYRAYLHERTPEAEAAAAQELEALYKAAGMPVASIQTGSEIRRQQSVATDVLIAFLLIMAALIALVGGLGLMGTMGMNVLERTREIGVLRAIGASDRSVIRLVLVEGMLIGVISWILAVILAIPISIILSAVVGIAFLTVPMDVAFSFDGFLIWLVLVLVLSALASVVPARRASRLTVREVLAYE